MSGDRVSPVDTFLSRQTNVVHEDGRVTRFHIVRVDAVDGEVVHPLVGGVSPGRNDLGSTLARGVKVVADLESGCAEPGSGSGVEEAVVARGLDDLGTGGCADGEVDEVLVVVGDVDRGHGVAA